MSPAPDVLVVGGGTSGAALAGLLVAGGTSVTLIEAGPDYGPFDSGRWPPELLDARGLPESHDWGHRGTAHATQQQTVGFGRARVIGGCSAHNGCVALSGTRADYDLWAEAAGPQWSWEALSPAFARAKARLRVTTPDLRQVQPSQRAFIAAAAACGISMSAGLDDPDEAEGVGPSPANIVDGVRWNSAFGYLDEHRRSPQLRIRSDTLVSRVILEPGRATGVEVVVDGRTEQMNAGLIVLAAGAYESPAILLRSGIGAPAELAAVGVAAIHDLPGVGTGLVDHPLCYLDYSPSETMRQRMAAAAAAPGAWIPEEQALAKVRLPDRSDPVGAHLFPWTPPQSGGGGRAYRLAVSVMAPRSTGRVWLRDTSPQVRPGVDHGYLSDPDGADRRDLAAALAIGRQVMGCLVERGELVDDRQPHHKTRPAQDDTTVVAGVSTYFHPAGTCRMGTDTMAVVDPAGRVRGINGLAICDASIFPTLPRANTNLPAAMVAEHLATSILGA